MRQVAKAQGATLDEFVEEYNEVCAELSRHRIVDETQINETTRLIFYEDEGLDPEWFARKCCECVHFNWSNGCKLRRILRDKMDPACQAFSDNYDDAEDLESLDNTIIMEVVS